MERENGRKKATSACLLRKKTSITRRMRDAMMISQTDYLDVLILFYADNNVRESRGYGPQRSRLQTEM